MTTLLNNKNIDIGCIKETHNDSTEIIEEGNYKILLDETESPGKMKNKQIEWGERRSGNSNKKSKPLILKTL